MEAIIPKEDLYQKIVESAIVAIGVTDPAGRFIVVNRAWCSFMGYTETEAMGLNIVDITHEEALEESADNYQRLINLDLQSFRKTRQYKAKDGCLFWADLNVSPIMDENGSVVGVLGIFINIDREVKAEQKQIDLNDQLHKVNEDLALAYETVNRTNQELMEAYKRLERLARRDELTNLYNRRVMEELIATEVKRTYRTKRGFAIAIADLDNFKRINDTYGHDCGDQVLKTISTILLESLRSTDYVGRWGGEEFILLFPETTCAGAKIVMDRIRRTVEKARIIFKDHTIPLTVTIGFSYQNENFSRDELLSKADQALYIGKRNGKNQVVSWEDSC
ncbi:MAG: diguanylate cyclase [Candidatus Cloacimonetes bacterium]|nr:diguanylate cyclase [Candidatus Cloacimonadota bacterium]